jgi:hypothetical protein
MWRDLMFPAAKVMKIWPADRSEVLQPVVDALMARDLLMAAATAAIEPERKARHRARPVDERVKEALSAQWPGGRPPGKTAMQLAKVLDPKYREQNDGYWPRTIDALRKAIDRIWPAKEL